MVKMDNIKLKMDNIYQILVSRLEIGKIKNFISGRSINFQNANKIITIEKGEYNICEIITIMIKYGNPTLKLNELAISSQGPCEISDNHKILTTERFYYDCSLGGIFNNNICNACMFRILKFSNNAICKIGKKTI